MFISLVETGGCPYAVAWSSESARNALIRRMEMGQFKSRVVETRPMTLAALPTATPAQLSGWERSVRKCGGAVLATGLAAAPITCAA